MVCPEELNGTEFDKGSVRDGGGREQEEREIQEPSEGGAHSCGSPQAGVRMRQVPG